MSLRLFSVLLCLILSAAVQASEDPRYQSVVELGELNGIALQCKRLDQVRRMKSAVVLYVPKERRYGLAFDQATNDAFLAFIKNQDACPSVESLARRVGHQIEHMQAVFAAH